MSRAAKILIALVTVAAVLLALNTIAVDNETKPAGVTIDDGKIVRLSGGEIQVKEDGPTGGGSGEPPIVLLHCYACSMRWWDGMVPLLSEDHRVIRLDFLGHGGSAKPASGYSMEEQAALAAEALHRVGVEGAVVVGHSMGGTVATALAAESSEIVDRLVIVDQAPDNSFGGLPFLAQLTYIPVLGQLLDRVSPDALVKDGYSDAFAPGYDLEGGFENPDQVVEDFNAMTYTSYDESPAEEDSYTEHIPLDQRLISAAVPLLVIFGAEDQLYDAREALAAYSGVPGARTASIKDAGHSPNVEKPEEVARLILEFAQDPGDEAESPLKGKGKNR